MTSLYLPVLLLPSAQEPQMDLTSKGSKHRETYIANAILDFHSTIFSRFNTALSLKYMLHFHAMNCSSNRTTTAAAATTTTTLKHCSTYQHKF